MGDEDRHRQRGLTLVECLVVVAIVALLAAISVPTLREQLAAARARAAANQLYSMVQTARSRALLSGEEMMLCPSRQMNTEPSSCEGHFGEVIALMTSTEYPARQHKVWLPIQGVTVRNRAGTEVVSGPLQWDQHGFGNRNVSLSVCSGGHNWSVVINRLGRPRLAKQRGVCP
ncbi:GspH/FimT family pseudopilin [Luminiphilus sp.]|nr:GspH/FimT family pseudopilin [Luminiphilus sp.]